MKRFLILAMIILILAVACVPAFARYAYVLSARDATGGQATGFAMSGLASSTSRFSGPQSGWSTSGAGPYVGPGINGTGYTMTSAWCYYCSDATPQKWGEWTFNVPDEADKSGYYDVYYGIRYAATSAQDMPPIWTMSSASGVPFVNSTQSSSVNSNVWTKIATQLQFNRGQAYTTRCASLGLGLAGKRMNFDMVAWVFVKTNAASGLTATVNGDATAIDLAWTGPSPAPATYTVQRKAGEAGEWGDLVTGLTATAYTDTTTLCGFTYFYRVICVDANGVVSGATDPASAQRCALGPPGQATNPNPADGATSIHTDIATISWTADAGATSHDVYFGTNPTPGTAEFKGNQAGTTWATGGALKANTDYYWRIDEKNSAGTTTGVVWHFKTGISLTIKAIRPAHAGNGAIDHFQTDYDPDAPRAWNVTTWHNAGDNVYIQVSVNTPYTWVGWSLNADGSSPFEGNGSDPYIWSQQLFPYTIPAQDTNVNLYAVYNTTTYTLTANASPTVGGTVVATNQSWPADATHSAFEDGEVAHLVATPASGYVFAGWQSDQAGTFVDKYASTTNYTMNPNNTVITGYFTHCIATVTDTNVRCIIRNDGTNGNEDLGWTGTVNQGAYSPTNNRLWSRVVMFPPKNSNGTARPSTIPALALRSGLARLAVQHTSNSSYNSGVTSQVDAYPITNSSWMGGTDVAGPPTYVAATWLTTGGWTVGIDGTHPATANWTTAGGDFDSLNLLGTQPWVGVRYELLSYPLAGDVDYTTILANGVILKSQIEGDINQRKGVGTGSAGTTAPYMAFPYDPPTGTNSGVIKNWAFLGPYAQGVDGDHQARIDTDQSLGNYNGVDVTELYLAPKTGATYGACTWRQGTSSTDIIDLLDPAWLGAGNTSKVTYLACYVKNPGASLTYFIGLGSDDYSKSFLDTSARAYKYTASGAGYDQAFQGPFTMGTGWHRLMVKVENGTVDYKVYLRLANQDRTALTGVDTFTFATSDDTAPANPTAVEAGGAVSGVEQTAVTAPSFTFAGAADPEVAGQGVSGTKGFKVYFGTDPAGVPTTFQTGWTFAPGTQVPGTYYLRVITVDQALNESAAATIFTFKLGQLGTPSTIKDLFGKADGTYIISDANVTGCVNGAFWIEETDRSAAVKCIGTATQGKKYTVTGTLATVDGQRVLTAATVSNEADGVAINPMIIIAKSAGGASTTEHPSVDGGIGLYNLGLLVKIAGTVTDSGTGYFMINDGGWATVKVISGSVTASGNVTVTGLLGVEAGQPTLTIRGAGDVVAP